MDGSSIQALQKQISRGMVRDRHPMRMTLNRIKRKANEKQQHDLTQRADRSAKEAKDRRAQQPEVNYPHDLPITAKVDEIKAALKDNQVLIICGETGSGKTTQLPKICMDLGYGAAGVIGHTQPRRLAARSVASRIGDELGSGRSLVGHKVRFDDKTTKSTQIKLMTDGILLMETQQDRFLSQYEVLIIDEAHERSLNIDFLLGYLKELLPKRRDLKIIITSATIDPESFSKHFNDAPVIHVSGRTYPVEVRYRPFADDTDTGVEMDQAVVMAVDELMSEGPGDVLVFLPGERDIMQVRDTLKGAFANTLEVLPLFSRLAFRDQSKIFKRSHQRRVVLSTNIAETSLTVPGIRYVIDTGLARISRYSGRSQVQRLPIEAVSKASADQRKGRCGRLGPGICIRLFSEEDFEKRPDFTEPEIVRSNLAGVLLQMKQLKLGELDKFPFIEQPNGRLISAAVKTLYELGAVDQENKLTKLGVRLAQLPVDPRVGRMLLAGDREGALRELVVITAGLSIPDPRERPPGRERQADEAHEKFEHPSSDFISLLNLWNFYQEQSHNLSGSKLRKCCQQNYLNFLRMREWQDVVHQLSELTREMKMRFNDSTGTEDAIHRALMTGMLNHVGTFDDKNVYEMAGGRKSYIFPGSVLFKSRPKWIMCFEIVETSQVYARMCARIDPNWIEGLAEHIVRRNYFEPHYDEESAYVRAFEKVSLFGLTIIPRRSMHYGRVEPAEARKIFIREALVARRYESKAQFWQHNEAMINEIIELEDKGRLNELLASEESRYEFYDKFVPSDICNGPSLEKWYEENGQHQQNCMMMRKEDLLETPPDWLTADAFPDVLILGELQLPLSYQFEPGKADDGVSVHVPQGAINQLSQNDLLWLVPGCLKELVVAMIKALPKRIRRQYMPADRYAEEVMGKLRWRHGDFLQKLAHFLSLEATFQIDPDDFRLDHIPMHLRMMVIIEDENGEQVAKGRNLQLLQKTYGKKLQRKTIAPASPKWPSKGITQWDISPLPMQQKQQRGSSQIPVYPCLVDLNDSTGVQVIEDEGKAKLMHQAGLRRLFILQTGREIKAQFYLQVDFDQLSLLYAAMGNKAVLEDDLMGMVVNYAFLLDVPNIRNAESFDHHLNMGWPKLSQTVERCGKQALRLMQLNAKISGQLNDQQPRAWANAIADMKSQLGWLMCQKVLSRTSPYEVQLLDKALQGMQQRLNRLSDGGLQRDNQSIQQVNPHWLRCTKKIHEHHGRGIHDEALTEYRWMVEAFRLQLFAPQIKPPMPVSEKRLNQQWGKVRE